MNTFSKLTPFLKTIDERNVLLAELQRIQQTFFSTDQEKNSQILTGQIRHDVSPVLQQLFESGDRQETFLAIESYLHQLEVVHVVLAFEPSMDQLEFLAHAIQTSEEVPRLLEIEVDPQIVGGMRVAIGGKYGDFSLRKKMTEYWTNHREEILASFRSTVHEEMKNVKSV